MSISSLIANLGGLTQPYKRITVFSHTFAYQKIKNAAVEERQGHRNDKNMLK